MQLYTLSSFRYIDFVATTEGLCYVHIRDKIKNSLPQLPH